MTPQYSVSVDSIGLGTASLVVVFHSSLAGSRPISMEEGLVDVDKS